MRNRTVLFALALGLTSASQLSAQVNEKGTVHAGIGIALGIHGTRYIQTTHNVSGDLREEDRGAAVTVTVPLRVGYGFSERLSVGLLAELGSYLDSNATRSNSLTLLSIEPQSYLVNTDRFAWTLSGQLGTAHLRFNELNNNVVKAKYSGLNYGLGTGIAFYFSDAIGMQCQMRYVATNIKLRDFQQNGANLVLDNFDANLRTGGVTLQLGLAIKF